jgi:hypothetical protein
MEELSYKIQENGVVRDMTSEERAEVDAKELAWNNDKPNRQLAEIREIRNRKLQETDYMANSDVTMPDYIKTWRQTLRDLPQNNTTESQYDTLLERNADGSLKNSVWTQPTE